jgi:hypothetical protein
MSAATFTLRTLLILVTAAAVGSYALTQHTPLWANVTVTMCYALLVLAALLALVRRGASRAFWAGFGVAGGLYAIVAFSPFLFTGSGALATTKLLIVGWDYVGPAPPPPSGSGLMSLDRDFSDLEGQYLEIMMSFNSSLYSGEQREFMMALRAYLQIGQSLWALVVGFGAGLLTALLYWRERRRDEKAASGT